ncbi:MAG: response regulator [Anaerolineae bacterium]|nr:response regulator [Anaerolineae bacterium]
MYTTALTQSNYDVIQARNSGEAINLLQSEDAPALIVMDISMPDAPGTKAIDFVRSEERLMNIPIIVITANEHYEERLTPIVERFFLKPVAISEIIRAVKELIP